MQSVNIQSLMEETGVKFGTSGVRGLVSAMSDTLITAYTLAFVKALNIKAGTEVGIATDLRPSSPTIAKACYSALLSVGIKPHYFGQIPTPALAYFAEQHKMPAIMVTGSHIPYDRNGVKFYSAEGEITKQHEIDIAKASVTFGDVPLITLPEIDPRASKAYVDRYVDFFPKALFSGKKIGFYEHSSVARDILTEILQLLGAEVISLERTNDFVPIDTEAVSQEDVAKAKEWAKAHQFDAIISTDGDADRPLIGDENGEWLRGDIVGLLTSDYLGVEAIATPVSCNTAIELCEKFKAVVRTRIGSPYVIAALTSLLENGQQKVAGFEANGGYMLASDLTLDGKVLPALCTRDAVLPILAIIALAANQQQTVSSISTDLPKRYTASDRIKNFATDKSKQLLAHFANDPALINTLFDGALQYQSIDQTDGLRITMTNGEVVHYRPSGNAPELRCYAESGATERSMQLVSVALENIQTVALT